MPWTTVTVAFPSAAEAPVAARAATGTARETARASRVIRREESRVRTRSPSGGRWTQSYSRRGTRAVAAAFTGVQSCATTRDATGVGVRPEDEVWTRNVTSGSASLE